MAQHISTKNSGKKELQNIYKGICKDFEKGISVIQSSLKFQEIFDGTFKESKSDKVFLAWRNFREKKENFEVHFDSEKKEITEIYLVK